jgi:hypothetical protein
MTALLTTAQSNGIHVVTAPAVIAQRQLGNVALYTSDADDMKKLCGGRVSIRAV